MLSDDTKIKCLKSEELYKFLGVPENVLHDVGAIVKKLKTVIQQRTNVIWTSPLSDYNKVVATNVFCLYSSISPCPLPIKSLTSVLKEIIQSLKVDNPGFLVEQATFIIDCMGGYSKDLIDNLSSIGLTRNEIDSILPKIQRIVITEANATINRFKVLTMK